MINKIFARIIAILITLPIISMEKHVRFEEPVKTIQAPIRILKRKDQFKYAKTKNLVEIKKIADLINLNAQEPKTKQTMLHYAVAENDYPTVQFLLQTNRVNTEIKNINRRTVHDLAVLNGATDIKKLLDDYILNKSLNHN